MLEIISTDKAPTMFGEGGRDYSVDLLRITSCFIVILMHSSLMQLPSYFAISEPGTTDYYWTVFFRTAFSAPTVLFVMVSGIFFLTPTRKVTIKKIWIKNIFKLTCAYIAWCYIYAYYDLTKLGSEVEITFKTLSQQALHEPVHLWYIPMMIALYTLAPVMRLITENSNVQVFKYMIVIFVIALFLTSILSIPNLPFYNDQIKYIIRLSPVSSICQYATWFLFGYIIYTYKPSKAVRNIVYVLGILSIFVAFYVNYWQFNEYGFAKGYVMNQKFSITCFFKNVALFLFFTTTFNNIQYSDRAKKIISKISGTTLIVYLMHWMILDIFYTNGWFLNTGLNPVIVIFVQAIIAFIIGITLSLIFNMIPWNKIPPITLINKAAKNSKKPAERNIKTN